MYGADMVHKAIFEDLSSAFPVVPTPLLAHEVPEVAPNMQRALEASMTVSRLFVEREGGGGVGGGGSGLRGGGPVGHGPGPV